MTKQTSTAFLLALTASGLYGAGANAFSAVPIVKGVFEQRLR
jgi:hypothetical protein